MPLLVVFGERQTVAGWTFPEALVVVGWFTLLQGDARGRRQPQPHTVVEHVRNGTLDFVLLKPADAQFLVSTAKFEPWRVVDVVGALGDLRLRLPQAGPLARRRRCCAGAGCSWRWPCVLLYSLWILVVSARSGSWVDNLTYLFGSCSTPRAGRSTVFRGACASSSRSSSRSR